MKEIEHVEYCACCSYNDRLVALWPKLVAVVKAAEKDREDTKKISAEMLDALTELEQADMASRDNIPDKILRHPRR